MKKTDVVALASGALFGVGLVVSGMTKPSKVTGFLDLFGHWDPSLAFVMVGAIGVYALLSRVVLRRAAPVFDDRFHLPSTKPIDARLVAGAAVFGVGWGLGGFCPGPGLVALGSGALGPVVFVVTMSAGMWLYHLPHRRRAVRSGSSRA